MQYRTDKKSGNELSLLGFGCMRFHRSMGAIVQDEATALVHEAIEAGVNYFDTAYIYPGSEAALGAALSGGWREKVFIADKLPLFLVKTAADFDKTLEKSLERLKTDRIDYYLMHMLTSPEFWERLRGLGIEKC